MGQKFKADHGRKGEPFSVVPPNFSHMNSGMLGKDMAPMILNRFALGVAVGGG